MGEIKIIKDGFKCERCLHEWVPRKKSDGENKPIVCPECKSPYWDKIKK